MREGITRYPMIPIVLSFASGIFLSRHFGVFDGVTYAVGLFICLSFLFILHQQLRKQAFQSKHSDGFYVFVLVGFLFIGGIVDDLGRKEMPYLPDKEMVATLVVTEKLTSNTYYHRYYVKAQSASKQTFNVLLYQSISMSAYDVGQEITGIFEFQPIASPRNPFGFDYQNYLSNFNIYYQTRLFNEDAVLSTTYRKNFYYYVNQLRDRLIRSFEIHQFDKDTHSVVVALLFGDTSELSDEVLFNYRNSGVMHVLAVSGLHVGILYMVFNVIFGFFIQNRYIKYLLMAIFLIVFACLSGLSGSVVRAVIMFMLFGGVRLIYRSTSTVNILAVAAFLMLLFYPAYLFDVGFQLSFLAVFSIVYIYPLLLPYVHKKNKIIAFFQSMLGVSLAAQIGVLPLSVYYFGQIPLLFLAGNFFAIPINSIALMLAVVMIPLNYLWKDLSLLLGKLTDVLLSGNNFLMGEVASVDFLIISGVPMTGWQCLLLTFAVFYGAYWLKSKKYQVLIVTIGLIIAFQSTFYWRYFSTKNIEERVLFYDSQQIAFAQLKQKQLHVFSNDSLVIKNYLADYKNKYSVPDQSVAFTTFNRVLLSDVRLLVIDSLGVYPKGESFDYVILYDSPNINLARCLTALQPKKLIIHPKNPRWKTELWRKTCAEKNIPFHDMREKGYFTFSD